MEELSDFSASQKETENRRGDETLDPIKTYLGDLFTDYKAGLLSDEEYIQEQVKHARAQGMIDKRTGFYNLEGLQEKLDEALEISINHNIPFTVAYIDGDKFKSINDEISHEAGNEAIAAMAIGIKNATRSYDVQAAMGESQNGKIGFNGTVEEARPHGDEFVVVLYGITVEQAMQYGIGLRILNGISNSVTNKVTSIKDKFGGFTASAGFADFIPEIYRELSPEDKKGYKSSLLNRADEALKVVKKSKKEKNYQNRNDIGVSFFDRQTRRVQPAVLRELKQAD